MLQSAIVYTTDTNSAEAGEALGTQINNAFEKAIPDAILLFASSSYNYSELLKSIHNTCNPKILVGCSSAGEFTTGVHSTGSACAIALRSDEMHFSSGIGRNLSLNREEAAKEIAASFTGMNDTSYGFRSAIILTDALAGFTDDLIKQLTQQTGGMYQFIGGGAGDDAQFKRTHIFCGVESFSDSVVSLEILSNKPIGMGVAHGWKPASQSLRVTESVGERLISLNSMQAVEAFEEHAKRMGQEFNTNNPLPFFLHNVIGIESGEDNYRLRVPLTVNQDGSISCASDIPEGSMVCFMQTTNESAIEAAKNATHSAISQLGDDKPGVALFFDCVATRLRMGHDFEFELQSIEKILGETKFAGANTYGQIARAEGQFSGFHNCTATVCILPK
ncbi:MAG TPA: FIST N-terminal domain-containing protein [Bacteriovoracaceae bacterium]|nr:FIST N-terminal domain-containing protein [Bacteriovoracaceae bacterium]